MNVNKELLIKKAREAKSAQELAELAKQNGVELSEESAQAYFALLNQKHESGAVSDEELENVSGGGCRKGGKLVVSALHVCDDWRCETCGGNAKHVNVPDEDVLFGAKHRCIDGVAVTRICGKCKYCSYEGGLWLCSHK